jgi:hypothetical protein
MWFAHGFSARARALPRTVQRTANASRQLGDGEDLRRLLEEISGQLH